MVLIRISCNSIVDILNKYKQQINIQVKKNNLIFLESELFGTKHMTRPKPVVGKILYRFKSGLIQLPFKPLKLF